MIPNNVLSTELKVTATLKENEVATFMLLNAAKKENGRDEPTTPDRWQLAGKQNITDPYDKYSSRKTIANVVGTIPVTEKGRPVTDQQGSPKMIDEIKGVIFEKGFVRLTASDNITFQYLMRRKDNLSNPFRNIMGGKSLRPIFKLMDDPKELMDILQKKEIQFTAQKLVRESSYTDLKAMATKMNESADSKLHVMAVKPGAPNDPASLKLEMIQKAEAYPKLVINSSNDPKSRLKVQIYECLGLGLLREDKGAFWLLGKDYEEIHKPAADMDSVDSLMKFFMESEVGKSKYQLMAETLKKTLTKA
jgi:hypothetical protein